MRFHKLTRGLERCWDMRSLNKVLRAGWVVLAMGSGCSSTPAPPPAMTTTALPSMGLTLEIPAGWVDKQEQDGSVTFMPAPPAPYRGRNSLQIWPGVQVPAGTPARALTSRHVQDGSLEFTVYDSEAVVGGQRHRLEAWVYFQPLREAVTQAMGSVRAQ